MPNINWNEEWEKTSPINVEDKVLIRAEFHEPNQAMEEIIIQLKMSFGTGHHPTTHLMIQQMLEMDFKDKKVLDMGCGTSVFAIYAKMKGAKMFWQLTLMNGQLKILKKMKKKQCRTQNRTGNC